MNLINPWTSDKPSRRHIQAEDDASVLYAMRLKIEAALERGLHEAHMEAILDLQILDPDKVMDALRKQLSPANVYDAFVDGFWSARKTLESVSGTSFPEPPVEVEE